MAQLTGADDRIEVLEAQLDTRSRRARRAVRAAEAGPGPGRGTLRRAGHRRAGGAGDASGARRLPLGTTPDPDGIEVPGVDGPVAARATGVDEVVLALAAAPDAPLRPIAQAASGGELSRTMLAIQVVLAGADPMPTMVFDEVDAGVGGAAAIEVGRRLQRLSERTQVIVVTHLAQVAAFADSQLVVTKDTTGSVTEASVEAVEGEGRVRELSRMLGGLADSRVSGGARSGAARPDRAGLTAR